MSQNIEPGGTPPEIPPPGHSPYYGHAYGAYYGGAGGMGAGGGIAIVLRKAVSLLQRRRRTILLGVLLGCAWTGYVVTVTPKQYQATCLIEMRARRPRLLKSEGAIMTERASSWQVDSIVNARLEKFRSRAMRANVIAYLTRIGDPAPTNVSDALFETEKRSYFARIICIHNDPERAAVSANAYASVAQEVIFEENRKQSRDAVAWLQEQAEVHRKALDAASALHVKFMSDNRTDVLKSQHETAANKVLSMGSRLSSLQNEILLGKDLCIALESMGESFRETGTVPSVAPHSVEIIANMATWRQAMIDRDTLIAKYRAKHPTMLAAEANVKATRSAVEGAIRRMIDTARADLKLQLQQADSLEKDMQEQQKQAGSLDLNLARMKSEEDSLLRTQQAADATYSGLLRRIEEARLSADENTTTVSIIQEAETPMIPEHPRPGRLLIIGLFFGSVAGLGIAILKDALDDPVTTATDVEQDLGLRVLGVVQQKKNVKRSEIAREAARETSNLISESFAGIRSILRSSQYKDMANSILLTSSAPGEGKTTVSCNLAISFARHGDKTLLVDLDLRRPRIGTIFSEAKMYGGGISEALLHNDFDADMARRLVSPTDVKNLDVAVSLPVAKGFSATEVLAKPAVGHFLEWAKANYDQVIIDSPPHGLISDAGMLADGMGGVILVCWADRSRKQALGHAHQHLSASGANVLGVVVNSVRHDIGSGFGSYTEYHAQGGASRKS